MYLLVILLVVISGLLYWLYWRWANRRLLYLGSIVPGPPAYPIIGNAHLFLTNPTELVTTIAKMCHEYGEYVRIWLGPELNIIIMDPDDVRLLLTSNKINCKGPQYRFTEPIIGPGILSGGPTWRNHRKIATPSYNKKSVHVFLEVFNQEAMEFSDFLMKKDPSQIFDIYHDVVQCTTSSVCQTLMGIPKNDFKQLRHLQEIITITPRMYNLIFTQMTRWWLQIPGIPWLTGVKAKQDKFKKLIDEFMEDITSRRRKAMEKGTVPEDAMGVVDRYMLSRELTEKEIKEESFTLFTTSQEAAAKIASGVLLFLGQLPDWQARVYDEIMSVVGTGPVAEHHLKELHYLDMVYKETLRYFSIAGLIQRTVEEDISINNGKITLPAGTTLVISIHELHRDPKNWEDPLRIMPERFLPENVKKRNPNAFIPFSLGPMDCLGRVYATALIKTLVIHVVRKVHLESNEPITDLPLEIAISVKASNGYNVKVRPRVASNGYSKTYS